jgi:hypothetical protein
MNRFSRGSALAAESWKLLRNNKTLLAFPLIALGGTIVVSIVFGIIFGVLGVFSGRSSDTGSLLSLVFLFLYYLANYFIVNMSNAALISSVFSIMDGGTPTVQSGYEVAMSRVGKIFTFSAIAATVGVIAQIIRQSGRESKNLVISILASILASTILGIWSVISFFVLPIILAENLDVFAALKRSTQLFRDTWGENLGSSFAFGCALFLGFLAAAAPGAILTFVGASANSGFLTVTGIILLVVVVALFSLISSGINAILQAALYRYAINKEANKPAPNLFPEAELASAYAPKGA